MVTNFGQELTSGGQALTGIGKRVIGRETGGSQWRPNVNRRGLKSDRPGPGGDRLIPVRSRWWLPGGLKTGGRDRRAKGIPDFERVGVRSKIESEVGQ